MAVFPLTCLPNQCKKDNKSTWSVCGLWEFIVSCCINEDIMASMCTHTFLSIMRG